MCRRVWNVKPPQEGALWVLSPYKPPLKYSQHVCFILRSNDNVGILSTYCIYVFYRSLKCSCLEIWPHALSFSSNSTYSLSPLSVPLTLWNVPLYWILIATLSCHFPALPCLNLPCWGGSDLQAPSPPNMLKTKSRWPKDTLWLCYLPQ